jgi:hypothetical protein
MFEFPTDVWMPEECENGIYLLSIDDVRAYVTNWLMTQPRSQSRLSILKNTFGNSVGSETGYRYLDLVFSRRVSSSVE